MSLLNVLRGSQSLPLTKSYVSISSENDTSSANYSENGTSGNGGLVYNYYYDPLNCTFEQVLISVRLNLGSDS
jgi:hypothetical protein